MFILYNKLSTLTTRKFYIFYFIEKDTHLNLGMCQKIIFIQFFHKEIISTEQQPQPQSLLLSFQYLHQFQNERIL